MQNFVLINHFLSILKEMILGASETAEIFDAKASVIQAAAHIAKLIKSSEHCVIFTGQ